MAPTERDKSSHEGRLEQQQQQQQHSLALEESLILAETNAANETKNWESRAAEFGQQAKARRAAARKLEEEAKHFEQQEQECRTNMEVTTSIGASLKLQTTLARLIRNDKDTVAVDTSAFPSDHGKVLCQALLRNDMVTELDFDLSCLLCTDNVFFERQAVMQMQPLLDYLSRTKVLVRLGMHDRTQDESPLFRKMAYSLLESISKGNQQLERLTWNIPVSPAAFHRTLTTFAALRELDVIFFDARHYSTTEQQTISSAFGSNQTLQKLKLAIYDNVAMYTSILKELRKCRTLQELYLKPTFDDDDTEEHHDAISQCAAVVQWLELEELYLKDSAMAEVLSGLRHPPVINGIPTAAVTTLSLCKCYLDDTTGNDLASFLKIKTSDIRGKTTYQSALRELRVSRKDEKGLLGPAFSRSMAAALMMTSTLDDVDSAFDSDDDAESSDDGNDDATADEIIESQDDDDDMVHLLRHGSVVPFMPTIGSQLHTLSLQWVHRSFFDHLQVNHHRIGHLRRLELVGISHATAIAFSKCIPYLASLDKLKILPQSEGKWCLDCIVVGLKKNGSIRDVEAHKEDDTSDFNATQMRLMAAYCQRNQCLEDLVESQPLTAGNSGSGGSGHSDTSDALDANNTAVPAPDYLLRPALLQATQQIPFKQLTALVRGLMVLGSFSTQQRDGEPESKLGTAKTSCLS